MQTVDSLFRFRQFEELLVFISKANFNAKEKDTISFIKIKCKAELSQEDAVPLINSYVKAHPTSWEAWFYSGYAKHFILGTDPVKDYEKSISLHPAFARSYNLIGRYLVDQNQEGKAQPYFRKALSINPLYAHAYRNLGQAEYYLGQYDSSLIHLNKAIALVASESAFYVDRGNTLLITDKKQEAINDFLKAIELDKEYGYAFYRLADAYFVSFKDSLALPAVEKALLLDSTLNDALLLQGRLQLAKKDYASALQSFRQYHSNDSTEARGFYYMALAMKHILLDTSLRKQHPAVHREAMMHYMEKALAKKPAQLEYYDELANIYIQVFEDMVQAAEVYTRALKNNKATYGLLFNRGSSYNYSNNFSGAIKDMDAAIALTKDTIKIANALSERGLAHIGLRAYDKALRDYDTAIALVPQSKSGLLWGLHLNRTNAWVGKAAWDSALVNIEKAISYLPANHKSWNVKSSILLMQEKHDASIAAIRHAKFLLQTDTTDDVSEESRRYYYKGLLEKEVASLLKTNRVEEAQSITDTIGRMDSTSFEYWMVKARLAAAKKDTVAALNAYGKVITFYSKPSINNAFRFAEYEEAYVYLIKGHFSLNEFERSKSYFEYAVKVFPTTQRVQELSKLYQQEQYSKVLPRISITNPVLSRGAEPMELKETVTIEGSVATSSGIRDLKINGETVLVRSNGNFYHKLTVKEKKLGVQVAATDNAGLRSQLEFDIVFNAPGEVRPIASQTAAPVNYALLIGVQNYQDSNIRTLNFPVSDAEKLKEVLVTKYAFNKQEVIVLPNPSRKEIYLALGAIAKKLTSRDNFLIFYAGHGLWDKKIEQGYWLPADAEKEVNDNYISNADIRDKIRGMDARHVLLISDACFSGGILQSGQLAVSAENEGLLARQAITSGNLTEVPDQSIFLQNLLLLLNTNKSRELDANKLYSEVKSRVETAGSTIPQPQFGIIPGAGHEGGSFVFSSKGQ